MTPENFTHYTLGIDEIDSEHWRLVCTMNSIHTAITEKNLTKVREFTKVLAADLVEHLSNEEAYMERVQYPYRAAHVDQHIELRLAMVKIIQQLEEGKLSTKLANQLFGIIAGHIDNSDLQIGVFMREQRVARIMYDAAI